MNHPDSPGSSMEELSRQLAHGLARAAAGLGKTDAAQVLEEIDPELLPRLHRIRAAKTGVQKGKPDETLRAFANRRTAAAGRGLMDVRISTTSKKKKR
jgi:hypothetical protein